MSSSLLIPPPYSVLRPAWTMEQYGVTGRTVFCTASSLAQTLCSSSLFHLYLPCTERTELSLNPAQTHLTVTSYSSDTYDPSTEGINLRRLHNKTSSQLFPDHIQSPKARIFVDNPHQQTHLMRCIPSLWKHPWTESMPSIRCQFHPLPHKIPPTPLKSIKKKPLIFLLQGLKLQRKQSHSH
jgi:hypothetical protein